MKHKILSSILFLLVLLGVSFIAKSADAQTLATIFPNGCSSIFGHSTTTGLPCNGTGVASNGPLVGCTSIFGYSTTTGLACTGGAVSTVMFSMPGCVSIYGYSTINGLSCNGTWVATIAPSFPPVIPTTPGLPTTGREGDATGNILLLAIFGLVAVVGGAYSLSKRLS